MSADWVARGVAIAGAVSGFGALGWNVISWRRNGPVLKATAVVSGRGDAMKVTGRLTNKGRMSATISTVTIAWMPAGQTTNAGWTSTRSIRLPVPDGHLTGLRLGEQLRAQAGLEYTINSVNKIDDGLNVALHDRRPASITFETATGRKTRAGVKYAKA